MGDELYENKTKQQLTREQAAARLHEIADELASNNGVRMSHGDRTVTVSVPAQVTLEVELEVEDGDSELEITIGW